MSCVDVQIYLPTIVQRKIHWPTLKSGSWGVIYPRKDHLVLFFFIIEIFFYSRVFPCARRLIWSMIIIYLLLLMITVKFVTSSDSRWLTVECICFRIHVDSRSFSNRVNHHHLQISRIFARWLLLWRSLSISILKFFTWMHKTP